MRSSPWLTVAGAALLVACASADDASMRRQKVPNPIASMREPSIAAPEGARDERVTRRDHSAPKLEVHAHFQPSPPPRPPVERPPRPPAGPGSK
ncbi:MAG TPA: hypothetical protein VF765_02890 [Polyangiaceae bacterium]